MRYGRKSSDRLSEGKPWISATPAGLKEKLRSFTLSDTCRVLALTPQIQHCRHLCGKPRKYPLRNQHMIWSPLVTPVEARQDKLWTRLQITVQHGLFWPLTRFWTVQLGMPLVCGSLLCSSLQILQVSGEHLHLFQLKL